MGTIIQRLGWSLMLSAFAAGASFAQRPLSWDEARQRFEANNPLLQAGQPGVDESTASEITAYLRPNPTATFLADQINPFPGDPSHLPLGILLTSETLNYLHERKHKRELRWEHAQEATQVAASSQSELERNLVFNLRTAMQSVIKAKTDHQLAVANGSTDPTLGFDVGRNPPIDQYIGASMSIPLRIFNRNQGGKLRTQLDVDRNQRLSDAARARVLDDVDSAHAAVNSTLILLQPYKDRYLKQAERVRDTISFSYSHGAASLLDFLNAQAGYRMVERNYLTRVVSHVQPASWLNLAVGREVIQ